MNLRSVVWGAMLIILGGLVLMGNLGLLPSDFNIWGLFWPLVFIGLGIQGIITATGRKYREQVFSVPYNGFNRGRVHLHHGAGALTVSGHATEGYFLDGRFGGGVIPRVSVNNEEVQVDLKLPDFSWDWPLGPSQSLDWHLGISNQMPLDLTIEGGASRMILDMVDMQLKRFLLKTGASSTEITFPSNAGETRARVESGAASVVINIPGDVAAQITTKSGLASINVDRNRFISSGDRYESPGFNDSKNRLILYIETGVGTVTVK